MTKSRLRKTRLPGPRAEDAKSGLAGDEWIQLKEMTRVARDSCVVWSRSSMLHVYACDMPTRGRRALLSVHRHALIQVEFRFLLFNDVLVFFSAALETCIARVANKVMLRAKASGKQV